jgi:hypothetical protein
MSKKALGRAFAVIPLVLLCWLLGSSVALADGTGIGHERAGSASTGTVPKAHCARGDHTESGLQGETTYEERFSGDSERAYNCNLRLVGLYRGEGAYSQDGPCSSIRVSR